MMHAVENIEIYDSHKFSNDILEKISADELLELIQKLPPRYRMVFNLFVMEGMSHQDISKEMNITVGTSKSNLARGRDILKQKVEELYGDTKKNSNFTA